MSEPITRDGEMSTQEANKLERIARAMGKKNNAHDDRVTDIFRWIAGIAAALIVVMLTGICTAMFTANATMAKIQQDIAVMKAESSPKAAQLDRVEAQASRIQDSVSSIDRRLVLVEARQK